MTGCDIFISYSREDRAAARHFAECFKQEGFSVWWDASLHSGEAFDQVIEKELKASRAVVVLWSPRSVDSRWVRAEATLADRRNKLAPVIIEPCDRPIIFELTHTADLSDWTGDVNDGSWQAFMKDLQRLVRRNTPRDAAPQPVANIDAPRGRPDSVNGVSRFGGRVQESPPVRESAPVSMPADDDDESDRTQFYTSADAADLLGPDEFHCLEMLEGTRMQQRFVVCPPGLRIGRTAPADIILADPRVSRAHCRVELASGGLRIIDLNSTNGTFVNGERVEGETIMEVGSTLRVGNIVFKHEVRTRADV